MGTASGASAVAEDTRERQMVFTAKEYEAIKAYLLGETAADETSEDFTSAMTKFASNDFIPVDPADPVAQAAFEAGQRGNGGPSNA